MRQKRRLTSEENNRASAHFRGRTEVLDAQDVMAPVITSPLPFAQEIPSGRSRADSRGFAIYLAANTWLSISLPLSYFPIKTLWQKCLLRGLLHVAAERKGEYQLASAYRRTAFIVGEQTNS